MENTENKHDTKNDLPLTQDGPLLFQSAESQKGTKAVPMPNLNSSETEQSASASGKDKDVTFTTDGERIICENTKAGLQKESTESAAVETTPLKAKVAGVSDTGDSSSPPATQTHMSSHQGPDDDDSNGDKKGESTKAFYYEKTVSSGG